MNKSREPHLVQLSAAFFVALTLISCAEVSKEKGHTAPEYAFEIIPEDESAQIADITAKTMLLQNKRAAVFREAQNGQTLRGVHPKSHGCVVAEFEVNSDIAPNLQYGLFAKPGARYQALIRFSNAAVRLAPDLENQENGSRGMAIKVFEVPGTVLVEDRENRNQDFLMINTSVFAFPNVRSYQRLTNALVNSPSGSDPTAAFEPADDWTLEDFQNLQKTVNVIAQIKSKAVRNPLDAQYFAAAPSTLGSEQVMKFSAEPCGGETFPQSFDASTEVSPDYLHEALASRMKEGDNVCFDFKIQVLGGDQVREQRSTEDGKGDLIEDATREWVEAEIPFTPAAKITIPVPQDIDLTDGDQHACKSSAFNPWHSLMEHKPQGGINRLRRPVYISSEFNRSGKP
jgi:catalase